MPRIFAHGRKARPSAFKEQAERPAAIAGNAYITGAERAKAGNGHISAFYGRAVISCGRNAETATNGLYGVFKAIPQSVNGKAGKPISQSVNGRTFTKTLFRSATGR